MRKHYETPELEIVEMDPTDVIVTSVHDEGGYIYSNEEKDGMNPFA